MVRILFCLTFFVAILLVSCGPNVNLLFEDPAGTPSASRFTPVLIFSVDAATADSGTTNYATGCAAGQLSWKDVSGTNTTATLTGFVAGDCSGGTADGWQGAGVPADPYRLNFDGVDDYVDVGDVSADLSLGLTIEVWARSTGATSWARFFDFGLGQQNENILFARAGLTNDLSFYTHRGATQTNVNAANVIVNNTWQYFVATTDPIPNTTNAAGRTYVNGAQVAFGTVQNFVNVVRTSNYIGRSNWAADGYYQGDIAVIKIYQGARNGTEVKENCQKDAARFGVTCS